jgi:hypothetical protein
VSHLPDIALKTLKRGQPLPAADLNHNFAALLALLDVVMHAALSPDPAGVANEVKLADNEKRLAALEHLTAMHARQRNERDLTPMAYTAAVMQQVRDLRQQVQRLAQQPEPATREDMAQLLQRIVELEKREARDG